MLLDAGFVTAVLEGFEGTLDEVVGRVASAELSADLAILQTRINALRVSTELPDAKNQAILPEAEFAALPTKQIGENGDDRISRRSVF